MLQNRTIVLTHALVGSLFLSSALRAHQDHSHSGTSSSEPKHATHLEDRSAIQGASAKAFEPFRKTVSTHVEGSFLVVESSGLPDHDMMVGIRAWQQQVPLPQPFTGQNAWRLPIQPRPADKPISVLTEPLRGAIALAVNGVPIFCALNNRSEDTYLAGELDQWGGHCGRGDDYHYHIAPIHLEAQVGVGNPIAFGLDGYPILGLTEADGSEPTDLDSFNGHAHDGHYHYHASTKFPYVNGGLFGVVTLDGDQIQQPKDSPVRPGQSPLRGATITGFHRDGDAFSVTYEVAGQEAQVNYKLLDSDRVEFTYVSTAGDAVTKVHQRGQPREGTLRWKVASAILCLTILTSGILFLRQRLKPRVAGD
ncbi:MAG: YHYH protein [Planctomycetota bacterium]